MPSCLRGQTCQASRLPQRIEIIADRLREPDVQRVADERVADRDFLQVRQPSEERKIGQIEIVSCVHTKTQRVRELGGIGVGSEARLALAGLERARERLCIQLDSDRRPPLRPT